jgi:hypothetical protein
MPSSPPTVASLCLRSHPTRLPWMVIVLPLALHLLSIGPSISRPPQLLTMPLHTNSLSYVGLTSRRASPLVTPSPPFCLRLCLSLSCTFGSHCLIVSLPFVFVAPLWCLLSTLAGCRLASCHGGTSASAIKELSPFITRLTIIVRVIIVIILRKGMASSSHHR